MSWDYYENSFDLMDLLTGFQRTLGVCRQYFDNCYSRQEGYVFAIWVFKSISDFVSSKMELLIPHTQSCSLS